MRILFTLLLVSTLSISGIHAQGWGWGKTVRGNKEIVDQQRDLKDFDGIKACCSLKVELTQGSQFSVLVKAESNLQEYIETKVLGNTLEIGFKDRVSLKPTEDIEIYITMPELTEIDASSSADIFTKGTFRGEKIKLESSSGSYVKAMFTGGSVYVDASSGGDVVIKGKADYVKAEASSGARVNANDVTAKEGKAEVSSGANIRLNVTETLKADASSGGRVEYSGSPANVDSEASSGGSIRKNEA